MNNLKQKTYKHNLRNGLVLKLKHIPPVADFPDGPQIFIPPFDGFPD